MARPENTVVEAADRFLRNFKRPARLLVAVSGGSDSLGLLLALAELRAAGRHPDIHISACTIDHDLRPGSAEEAAWVGETCAQHGVAHITRRWEGGKPQAGIQAAARAARYVLLTRAAVETGADAVLSAHTLDDQRETVAMRAERSMDGAGLAGMADAVLLHRAVWLFRPLLAVTRGDIRSFLDSRGQGWVDDPSNANMTFERVRVRARSDVASSPFLSDTRLSLSLRGGDYLRNGARADGDVFSLTPAAIDAALDDPAAWRALLLLAAVAGGRAHILEARAAGRLRAFLASDTLSRLTAGRVVFDRRRDGLHLYRECRGIVPLTVPAGAVGLWDNRYRVVNHADRAIVVSVGGGAEAQGLRGPALRARDAAPSLVFEGGGHVPEEQAELERIVAPYDQFLPRFDLPVAQALAALAGRPPFSSPPNE